MARIVVLTGCYPRHGGDPAGAHVAAWARAMAGRGHSLVIVAPADRDAQRSERDSDLPIEILRAGPHGRLWYGAGAPENLRHSTRAWLEIPRSLGALSWAARRALEDADLVWSHWIVPFGAVGALVAAEGGVPHVAQVHGSDLALLEQLGPPWARRILGSNTQVVCVADEQRSRLLALACPRRPIAVIPMGVESPPPRASLYKREPTGPPVVLVLSRLIASKGVDLVIRALARWPNLAHLWVVGDGPEGQRLEGLAAELGVRATFFGACAPTERWQHLARARVLVVPSRGNEGCPVVVGEAQAMGLPVIGTRVGGLPEALGGNGMVVPPEDVSALAGALACLLFDRTRAEALGGAGRAGVEYRLWPNLVARYDDVVASCLASR